MTRERGAVAAEIAVLAPALMLCALFVVLAGRIGQAAQDVEQAAAEGARTASLSRGGALVADARTTVRANLAAAGVRCGRLVVDVATADVRPGGSVRVDVACAVDLRDVAAGLAREQVVTAHAVEVIDTYRGAP